MASASEKDILECQFEEWYSNFENDTLKSKIIHLDSEFMKYLTADGVYLPNNVKQSDKDYLSDDDECIVSKEQSNNNEEVNFKISLDIIEPISAALRQSQRGLFIKLNWSAPTDASWLFGNSVRCRVIDDVLLLLKSSDRIIFDIEHMFKNCIGSSRTSPDRFTLVLRNWADLTPSMEFRVFVRDCSIVGISQRICSTYFPFLRSDRKRLSFIISYFFQTKVHDKFPLSSYALDLYIDRKERVWIIDFNPFGEPTNSLLFDWSELVSNSIEFFDKIEVERDDEMDPELDGFFRVVTSNENTLPDASGSYRGPIDVHLSQDFSQFMDICKKQQQQNETANNSDADDFERDET